MAASHFKAGNLVAILDYNKYQETGPISREIGLEPLVDKVEELRLDGARGQRPRCA